MLFDNRYRRHYSVLSGEIGAPAQMARAESMTAASGEDRAFGRGRSAFARSTAGDPSAEGAKVLLVDQIRIFVPHTLDTGLYGTPGRMPCRNARKAPTPAAQQGAGRRRKPGVGAQQRRLPRKPAGPVFGPPDSNPAISSDRLYVGEFAR
jgi:hypothetical protein